MRWKRRRSRGFPVRQILNPVRPSCKNRHHRSQDGDLPVNVFYAHHQLIPFLVTMELACLRVSSQNRRTNSTIHSSMQRACIQILPGEARRQPTEIHVTPRAFAVYKVMRVNFVFIGVGSLCSLPFIKDLPGSWQCPLQSCKSRQLQSITQNAACNHYIRRTAARQTNNARRSPSPCVPQHPLCWCHEIGIYTTCKPEDASRPREPASWHAAFRAQLHHAARSSAQFRTAEA